MNMFPTLTADQIEVKVKQVTQKGALLLLYKTARTDYEMLDATCGPEFWDVNYAEVKGALFCTISIWSDKLTQWVSKSNCGTESREDGEGNEKKGEASDAMKRAGFVWGIGRELYTAPFIFVNVPTEPRGSGFVMKDRFATFEVKEIGYDEKRRINKLVIVDNKGATVFTYPRGNVTRMPTPAPASSRPAFVPSGHTNPNTGEAMGYDRPQSPPPAPKQAPAMRTDFQRNEIKRLCNDTQFAIMEEKYGAELLFMTFEQAAKDISALKRRAGEEV